MCDSVTGISQLSRRIWSIGRVRKTTSLWTLIPVINTIIKLCLFFYIFADCPLVSFLDILWFMSTRGRKIPGVFHRRAGLSYRMTHLVKWQNTSSVVIMVSYRKKKRKITVVPWRQGCTCFLRKRKWNRRCKGLHLLLHLQYEPQNAKYTIYFSGTASGKRRTERS